MGAQAVRLTSIDIDNALNNNHFEVIFQPVFDLSDGALLRMEAFVRWVHPGLGVLPPGAFISFFENQGRMNELTRYVMRRALKQYKAWRGNKGPGFSVNLAFSDLADETFPEWMSSLLEDEDFPAELVTLECPNTPASISIAEAAECFGALKNIGTRLAVEVRGRTNDVLREIDPFPFDEVKTGGSAILRFARTVRGGPGLTAISELLELAHKNYARTVAVGVEDQASLQALASLGFMAAQGNYLAGVGDANDFKTSTINEVRNALSLDPLTDDELSAMMGDAKADPSAVPAETPENPDADAAAENTAEQEQLAAAKAERQKKRRARQAAKQRAMKKAAALKARAEKAQAELEQKQQKLKEAAARREAEENARKLQERLTQTYEDTPDLSAAVSEPQDTPKEDEPAPEAGLLLGGSLANSALGRRDPEFPSTGSDKPPVADNADTAAAMDDVSAPSAGGNSAPDVSELWEKTGSTQLAETPRPSGLKLSGIEAEKEPVPELPEVALSDVAPEQRFSLDFADARTFPSDADPAAKSDKIYGRNYVFQRAPEPAPEVSEPTPEIEADSCELKSEDELLDEAFQDSEVLDPTGHHEELVDDQIELDSTERHIAEKLLRSRVKKKRKNFLQRKYRITHFWPKSWKRKWQAARLAKLAGTEDLAPDPTDAMDAPRA